MIRNGFLFLSDPSPLIDLPCKSLNAVVETWSMWPWYVMIHTTSPKVTQPLLSLLYRILPNQTSCWRLVQYLKLKFCQDFEAVASFESYLLLQLFRQLVWELNSRVCCAFFSHIRTIRRKLKEALSLAWRDEYDEVCIQILYWTAVI